MSKNVETRRRYIAQAAIAAVLGGASFSQAALTWDVDSTTSGAKEGPTAGASTTWTSDPTVKDFYNGTIDVAWPNNDTSVATFGSGTASGTNGTAGSVTVDAGGVTTNGIIFNTASAGHYTLAGGGITLSGTTPTITANVDFSIISAPLTAAGGFTKNGAKNLTLSGNNIGVVGINITAGNLTVSSANGLGSSSSAITIGSGATLTLGNSATGYGGGDMTLAGGTISCGSNGSYANNINVTASSTIAPYSGNVTGSITAASGITLAVNGTSNSGINGSLSNFLGTMNLAGTTVDVHLGTTAGASGGGVTYDLGPAAAGAVPASTAQLVVDTSGSTYLLGALAGTSSSTILAGAKSNVTNASIVTFQIGDKNLSTNFYGSIRDNPTIVFSGSAAPTGNTVAIVKTGSATQTLSGASTYSGTTSVNQGTLLVNGSLSGAGNVTVASSATLGGSGMVGLATGKSVSLSGTLAPGGTGGTSIDNFGIGTGGLTLASTGTLAFDVNLATGAFDHLTIGGDLTYGTGKVNVIFSGAKATAGSYDLIDFARQFGTESFAYSGLASGQSASFDPATGVVSITAAPEPASLSLLGLGVMGLIGRRKQRSGV